MVQVLQRQINKKRDECEQRIVACKIREALLEEKQFKIQEAIKRFDKFIQENDVKRSRAAKKERDERQERIAKEAEADGLTAKFQDLQVAYCFIDHSSSLQSPLVSAVAAVSPSNASGRFESVF
jgi:Fic family protein